MYLCRKIRDISAKNMQTSSMTNHVHIGLLSLPQGGKNLSTSDAKVDGKTSIEIPISTRGWMCCCKSLQICILLGRVCSTIGIYLYIYTHAIYISSYIIIYHLLLWLRKWWEYRQRQWPRPLEVFFNFLPEIHMWALQYLPNSNSTGFPTRNFQVITRYCTKLNPATRVSELDAWLVSDKGL